MKTEFRFYLFTTIAVLSVFMSGCGDLLDTPEEKLEGRYALVSAEIGHLSTDITGRLILNLGGSYLLDVDGDIYAGDSWSATENSIVLESGTVLPYTLEGDTLLLVVGVLVLTFEK